MYRGLSSSFILITGHCGDKLDGLGTKHFVDRSEPDYKGHLSWRWILEV